MDKNNFSEIYKKYVMTAYSAAMQVGTMKPMRMISHRKRW